MCKCYCSHNNIYTNLAQHQWPLVWRSADWQILHTGATHGPLTRYAKLRFAHAPGMPGTFFPPPLVSDPDMHHDTYLTHVPWCMSESLTSGVLWNWWRGKCSRHSRRMRNPQFCVSGKRPMRNGFLWDFIIIELFFQHSGLSSGGIAGIVIGVLIVVILVLVIIMYLLDRQGVIDFRQKMGGAKKLARFSNETYEEGSASSAGVALQFIPQQTTQFEVGSE